MRNKVVLKCELFFVEEGFYTQWRGFLCISLDEGLQVKFYKGVKLSAFEFFASTLGFQSL